MTSGIYLITNTVTGDTYIGKSVCIESRWAQHTQSLKKRLHHNASLQKVFDSTGIEAFTFRVLEECSAKNCLLDLEKSWKAKLDPTCELDSFEASPSRLQNVGLRALRTKAGLTFNQVSAALGIRGYGIVEGWEKRGLPASSRVAETRRRKAKLCEIYGCTLDDLEQASRETIDSFVNQPQKSA